MEMLIHYSGLPKGMEQEEFKLAVANLLEEDGWLTGSETTSRATIWSWSWRTRR